MVGTVATVRNIQNVLDRDKDSLASSLISMYSQWRIQRDVWEAEKKELRNYIFATDTTTTTNSSLPWKN